MTIETIFIYIVFLFSLILLIILFYYLRFYKNKVILVEKEYENSKKIIKNIAITYKKRQEVQENKMERILYNIEDLLSKIELLDSTITDQKKKILSIDDDIKTALLANIKMSQRLLDLEETGRSSVISRKSFDISQSDIHNQSTMFQENTAQLQAPIWDDSVLNGLTDTEKQILTILVKQGEKTSPEIEKIIDKTREHTSRLMKKLFREGYVNRNTRKIPYVYKANNDLIDIINTKVKD